jgi:two-component system capsular synthesis sensor histidine kinase RcsC
MLWSLGALLTTFYVLNIFQSKEAEIREEGNLNYDQAQNYIKNSADIMRDLRYMTEKQLNSSLNTQQVATDLQNAKSSEPLYLSSYPGADCSRFSDEAKHSLSVLGNMIHYWKENFPDSYQLERVFLFNTDKLCLVDFGLGSEQADRKNELKMLHDKLGKYADAKNQEKETSVYWVTPAENRGTGYLYMLTPIYVGNKLQGLLGIQQTLRLEDMVAQSGSHTQVTFLDENNQPLLHLSGNIYNNLNTEAYSTDPVYFGYTNGYHDLVYKKPLSHTALSIVYSISFKAFLEQFNMLIFNAILLNIFSATVLFVLAWVFERKIFLPAEDNALRLEEHEQFNHKIVASAPVGISILRISDGVNILSNALAHNYITMLTHQDRQRITRIICEQQVNVVDIITRDNHNIQLSFVHSRYRNEDVAICVLMDVSARVKMEESLQEMATAAEQASQSKSMFLATVSHELRTPLYGIIGNLDLLQSQGLQPGVERLVTAMKNSSALLLKIISDILDFSKIESEQLKIEPQPFSCREVIAHIVGNYLPLVVKKQLALYCFIEHDVPDAFRSDPVRLQQVLSNILNNAIKFTDTGCIMLHVHRHDGYLLFSLRDTGVGIPAKEVNRLFDPFFQVGSGVQRHFQGTGLGLAICEKLINLMDGDIAVESEPGLGSLFTVRIPLYDAIFPDSEPVTHWQGKCLWLDIRNSQLECYLQQLLQLQGAKVFRLMPDTVTASEDILITDTSYCYAGCLRAQIEFSVQHIGSAQENNAGYWIHSTATPLEVVGLINRIYQFEQPEQSANSQSALPAADQEQDIDNDDINLLIVDDHPINRRLLADQLASLGYQVITANDGMDALEMLKNHHADMVLTDVNMPKLDGYGLTQRLREIGYHSPVIGVTANALAEEKQRCLQAGMDNCLSKPVTLDQLRKTVGHYARTVRRQRENAPSE